MENLTDKEIARYYAQGARYDVFHGRVLMSTWLGDRILYLSKETVERFKKYQNRMVQRSRLTLIKGGKV
jgi:hypothetical protein